MSGSREEAWGGRRRVPPPWGQEVHHKSSHGAPGTPYPAPRGLPEATWPPATWSPRPPGPAPARGAPGDGGHHGQATVTPGGPGVQCRAGGAGRRESERVGVWGAGEEPERGAGRGTKGPFVEQPGEEEHITQCPEAMLVTREPFSASLGKQLGAERDRERVNPMGAGRRSPRPPWEAGGSEGPLGGLSGPEPAVSCLPGLVCGRRAQSPKMAAWPRPSYL